MAITYDEDLMDNAFFQALQKDYSDIFVQSITEGCVVCVPRAGSLPTYNITLDDILGHILIPNYEMPESHFQTLCGKEVKISNRVVTVEYDLGYHLSTHILFEETYYTDELLKYKVLCIENPLEPKSIGETDGIFAIQTLRDCMDLLWIESANKNIVEHLDRAIEQYIQNSDCLECASLQTLKDITSALYAKCLQIVFKDVRLKEKTKNNIHAQRNLKLAVESYVQHGVYAILFKFISACTSHQDSKLNKTVRNSMDLQLRDMDVRQDLLDCIPKAKLELSKIDGYSTVLGKLGCLKKMMTAVSRDGQTGAMIAADDLLPIIIFIVIKTNISNWFANLTYMKQFHFSSASGQGTDEDEFLVTTLEAAIEHIRSGVFLGPSAPEGQGSSTSSKENILEESKDDQTTMTYLFEQVSRGNLEEVAAILEKDCNVLDYSSLELCHPLCLCDKCQMTVSKSSRNINPTAQSCDDAGLTALHIAAMYGKPNIVEYLLNLKADVGASDLNGYTPLHHAALRGHQSTVLLLAQHKAHVNAADNSLNTPLHLCCLNGHEGCVKALIYHCEYEGIRLYINGQNTNGDTPLHHASKWGYLSIVELLVENHADPNIPNRRKLTPANVSNNCKVTEILAKSKSKVKESFLLAENFDFLDDVPDRFLNSGEIPNSTCQMKRVEKLLKAINCDDVNLACFYLGLNPMRKLTNCHPLCGCSNCKKMVIPTVSSCQKIKIGINSCNSEGLTALHVAASKGLSDFVQVLISNGANVDIQTRSKLTTPLMLAVVSQRQKTVQILLDACCNINLQDSKGDTALHVAVASGHRRILQLLLQYKPKLSIRNKSGRTALDEAESKRSLGIVNMLKGATNL